MADQGIRLARHHMSPPIEPRLASRLARLALAGVTREYPHKPDHVFNSAADARTPRALHPTFYGSYDWHSSVHSHWALACLAARQPDLPEAGAIEAVFAAHLTEAALAAEHAYLLEPNRASFERPYGWAWLFKLHDELAAWRHPDAPAWRARLEPLARLFGGRLVEFLPRQTYPVRAGTHVNTAFALGFAFDHARAANHETLARSVREAALRFYENDRDGPANYEPGGNDFLSPCLIEADLMARLLGPTEFARWLTRFLPGFIGGSAARLLVPAQVSDRADPQGVHLDGLNLSRAWCLAAIERALPLSDQRKDVLRKSAAAHLEAGLAHIESGDFVAEHWLGSFAVCALAP